MITEDYCSYEVSKLLEEKGFPQNAPHTYKQHSCTLYNAYSHQIALKWLREEKHFYIQIMLDSWALGGHSGYYIVIQDINSDFEEISPRVNEEDTVFFSTYEEAVDAALLYTLENLI